MVVCLFREGGGCLPGLSGDWEGKASASFSSRGQGEGDGESVGRYPRNSTTPPPHPYSVSGWERLTAPETGPVPGVHWEQAAQDGPAGGRGPMCACGVCLPALFSRVGACWSFVFTACGCAQRYSAT